MQVERTNIDALNTTLKVIVEPADYQEAVEKELKNFRKKANVPGFRPGMVPMNLVKKMYGHAILGEKVNDAIGKGLYDYIKKEDLNVLGDPLPNENDNKEIDWENQTTFDFTFDIALAPEFDAKLNGKNKLTYYEIEVTDKMVDEQVKGYQSRFGEYIAVGDGIVATDMLKGKLIEQKEGGIEKEKTVLMPEYMADEDQKKNFIGAKKGDIITFNPNKAYNGNEAEISSLLGIKKEEVAEQKSDFTFQIEEITRRNDAEINGELFAKVYPENTPSDEAAFRAKIREEIAANMKADSDYKFGLDAKEAILKKMDKLEFPEAFLKRWLKATNKEMTDETIEKDFPEMLNQLRWQLAKDQIIKDLKIEIKDEDVKAYAKEVARMQYMQYGMNNVPEQYLEQFAAEMMKKEDQLRHLVDATAEKKLYEALKSVVKLENKTISQEDFGKLFEKK